MSVKNADLRELYSLLSRTVDGYNRTHGVQVNYLDFNADVPEQSEVVFEPYAGSLVYRRYDESLVDYHYRDLADDDFDWWQDDDWQYVDRGIERERELERITRANRREAQERHREGLRYAPWLSSADPYPSWLKEEFGCL